MRCYRPKRLPFSSIGCLPYPVLPCCVLGGATDGLIVGTTSRGSQAFTVTFKFETASKQHQKYRRTSILPALTPFPHVIGCIFVLTPVPCDQCVEFDEDFPLCLQDFHYQHD